MHLHKDSSPSLLGFTHWNWLFLSIWFTLISLWTGGKCLGVGSALTHASFLWETLHTCTNALFIHYATGYNQSILSQRTMGVAFGQVKSSSLGCYWCIPINDGSSPLRVKPDGRSGLLFQISLQPSVCSELIEPNWPDHSLLSEYLNVASYLLRAYKTTSNAMPPLGWSDDLGESLTQMESIS